MTTAITGDPKLAQAIEQIRGARIELEAANWIEGKTIDQVRAEIHRMHRQAKLASEPEALVRAEALLEALNVRQRAQAYAAKGRP